VASPVHPHNSKTQSYIENGERIIDIITELAALFHLKQLTVRPNGCANRTHDVGTET